VQEYIDLEPEAALHRPDTKLPEDWPSKGEIVRRRRSLTPH